MWWICLKLSCRFSSLRLYWYHFFRYCPICNPTRWWTYELQNESPAFVKKNDGGFLIISSHICHAQFSLKEVFFEAPCMFPVFLWRAGSSYDKASTFFDTFFIRKNFESDQTFSTPKHTFLNIETIWIPGKQISSKKNWISPK